MSYFILGAVIAGEISMSVLAVFNDTGAGGVTRGACTTEPTCWGASLESVVAVFNETGWGDVTS